MDGMDTTYTTSTHQAPGITTGGWIAIAVCTVVLTVPADLFIHLVFTSSCSQPADPDDVLTGRVAMLIVLLVAALPWLVAVPLSRNSGRGAVIGLVALLPAMAFMVHGLTAGAWSSSLCLGG
jgi:hypothetical protein